MSEIKHTPGPWTLETVTTSVGICHKIGPFPPKNQSEKLRHACLYADYPSTSNPVDQELLANARLIAAAPELLEALIWVKEQGWLKYVQRLKQNAEHCDNVDRALAAIAKATGSQS
jgi:hypothetical protein